MSKGSGYRLEYLEKYGQRPSTPPPEQKSPLPDPKKPRGCVRLLIWLVQLSLLGLLLMVVAGIGGYIYLNQQLAGAIEQVTTFRGSGAGGTPRFYDRNGNLLFELTTTEKRRWLQYNEIPRVLIDATVAAEDDTFWTNPGVDVAANVAALVRNYRNPDGRPVGASTITQQLVRHIAFTYEERIAVSYQRKLREMFLAFILTQQRSKEAIIQMYLNEIYYGNLAYGIEAAAQTYFGKPATELTLGEAAFLAGLPQSPYELDPYSNFAGAKARQEFILDLMLEEGYIDYIDAEVAKGAPLTLAPLIPVQQQAASAVLEAPHFVLYAQNELEQRYGPDALSKGGWQVTTSLDLNLYKLAEQAVREGVAANAAAHDVSNGSVVVIKPSTGEILAMVGSLDYFNDAIAGQVNVALQPRQPGSAIKPVTYATALARGWSTADVLWDVPIKLNLGDGQEMTPVNYDGRYHGPVLFRDALANSYNIPPIQLLRDVGLPAFIATARSMGIESFKEDAGYYGLAITLGGGEVPLLELTHAYATLANMGQKPRLTSILRITDSRGNVVYDEQRDRVPPVNAIDPRIAYILTDILDDDNARIPAMGRGSALELPFPAAVKTGTTTDYRDAWTVGYTPGVVVGVWLGNSDGHPMRDLPGLRGAAPVWNAIMQGIYGDEGLTGSLMVDGRLPPNGFTQPAGLEARQVCLPAGTGGTRCTSTRVDLFMTGVPQHGIAGIQYNTNAAANPGAWTLVTQPLSGEDAQKLVLSDLSDGTKPPRPTECVVNSARPADSSARLFLPVPPYYPDEVRARLWAQGTGYRMAPATVCPLGSVSASGSGAAASTANDGSIRSSSGAPAAIPASGNYYILAPSAGSTVSGLVMVHGTAVFDPAQGQYYTVEISSDANPGQWTAVGGPYTQPVSNGTLAQLQADALPSGGYTLRLAVVNGNGGFAGDPHLVPIHIGS
ncbi:MAG: transglycosylase domain-containing protein [Ardenticatenaceae bacterium]|nr:transglycosylase domain-containing protein [Ardenticatenaceae bacterium]MCB8988370.1 transglycosylase domain-containing protein [Ardenticatenaceae bacterium]